MPRPRMKRAIPERSFLPPREPGRTALEASRVATHPGIADSLLDQHRVRRAGGLRAVPPSHADGRSRPSRKIAPLRWLEALSTWLNRRAERRILNRATERLGHAQDHLLKDIGISRYELTYGFHRTRNDF